MCHIIQLQPCLLFNFQSSRQHVTEDVLDCFLKLTKYLVDLPTGGALLKHLFDYILFNPALWIYSPVAVRFPSQYSPLEKVLLDPILILNKCRLTLDHVLKLFTTFRLLISKRCGQFQTTIQSESTFIHFTHTCLTRNYL